MFTKTEKTILNALPNEHEAYGGDWLKDWLASAVVGVRPVFMIATYREEAEACHS